MDITQVRIAKDNLRAAMSDRPWYRGVGIVPKATGYALRLNVSPDAQAGELPSTFQGLHVEIVRIDEYRPRRSDSGQ